MSLRRVALLSVHSSPLAQPGRGDSGGMSVYVQALARGLARAGIECDVLTRAEHRHQAPVVEVEDGFRVVHLRAGPREPIPKHDLLAHEDALTRAALEHLGDAPCDVLHANYWISGILGHRLKHDLDLPLVATFHTLALVKARAGLPEDHPRRARAEQEIVQCADLVLASTAEEGDELQALYGASPDRVEIAAPGVDHEVFSRGGPVERVAARRHLGLGDHPVLLFVGRIQPLKGADVAVRVLAALSDPRAQLLVVGGPSGPGGTAEVAHLHQIAHDMGVANRVRFVTPQPHDRLPAYYRAADVCLVPSRSESFGLVALEAAACGTPVVASNVGGLRSLVDDGVTGFLVDGHDPARFAAATSVLLAEPELAATMRTSAQARSRRYAWTITAARLRRLYADLLAREPVSCR